MISSSLATEWKHCYDTGNFTANSTYARNRNLLLSSLASNITGYKGFYNTTIGQDPDKVYGLALCRGDVSSEDYRSHFGKVEMDVPVNAYWNGCTPDLSQSDCHFCLRRYLDEYKKCYHGRQAGGVESPNCMLRWDLSPFYKDNIDVPPLLSPPPAPSKFTEEYAMHGQFSVKLDIFSFGLLILEIVSGQKNTCFQNGESVQDLLGCAWKLWRDGTVLNLVDSTLRSSSRTEMIRCIHIGLLCVQENAADRPTMASLVLMLNSYSVTFPVPSKPAFFMHSSIESDMLSSQDYNSGRRVLVSQKAKSNHCLQTKFQLLSYILDRIEK
ncbi:hypothetical protein JRO89_XS06G0104200 [Xanthoceras sorbifolium]|uniref:Gnk2-homologous domain-containing protein n=1 Tax=Xanthoceras sorbifolium TaxID=99658 RepID=A0ABQ8HXK8_9ROSI|nr:hypothetical protein JRO89_XS06G0104200 [Xanthoceras sorbifolium]